MLVNYKKNNKEGGGQSVYNLGFSISYLEKRGSLFKASILDAW